MKKPKPPVYKYKIQQFCRKNLHTDKTEKTWYRVLVKDKSSILNPWLFLNTDGKPYRFSLVLENAYQNQGFFFDDLDAVDKCIEEFRQFLKKDYELSSYTTLSEIKHGDIII